MGLIADQEHGSPAVPQPMLEMMSYAAGVAHAARRDDDMKTGEFGDRFAFVDGLGEPQMRRIERPIDVDAHVEARGMLPEHLGGVYGQRRIEEYRRRWHLAVL